MTTYTGGWVESPNVMSALIADVGEYTGPWPVPPPRRENMPLDCGEIDYLVALPNPSGGPDDTIDGTYPTMSTWSWRYWTAAPGGETGTHQGFAASSGGAPFVDALPAGAHLFVGWYDVDFNSVGSIAQPSKAALELVPPGFAAGGTGASGPVGRWSDWQDPWVKSTPIAAEVAGALNLADGYLGSGTPGDLSVRDAYETAKTNILDGTTTTFSTSSGVVFAAFAGKSADFHSGLIEFGALEETTQAALVLGVTAAKFVGSVAEVLDAAPPDLATKDYGQIPDDYRGDPNTFQYVQYEDSAPTFDGWNDLTANIGVVTEVDATAGDSRYVSGQSGPTTDDSTAVEGYSSTTFANGFLSPSTAPLRISVFDSVPSITALPAYDSGVINVDLDVAVDTPGAFRTPFTDTIDLALSTVDAADIGVLVASRYQGADDIPDGNFPELTMPTLDRSGSIYASGTDYQFNVFAAAVGLVDVGDPLTIANTATVKYLQPRWRYWIPDMTLAWHTVGGHFATVGPAGLKILTPGVGWVPLADGPA